MISGLQGEFGDLDNKYLKNIPKYLKISVGNIRKLQENTAALYTERRTLRVNVIRRSGYVWPEKLKCPPLPSGCEISGCKMLAYGILSRVDWAMLRKGGPSACTRCRDPSPGWHGVRKAIRMKNPDSLRGHAPPCYPVLVNITLRMIAYPIRIWCPDGKYWLKWASLATAHVPPLSNGVSGRPVRTSFAMDSKELSWISDCFGDKKAIKTPKLNTIWL